MGESTPAVDGRDWLPIGAILPGLIAVALADVLGLTGCIPDGGPIALGYTTILLVLPWITLRVMRFPARTFGFRSRRLALDFGWGAVAGGVWRLVSLLLNLALLNLSGIPQASILAWFPSLVLVPWVEEIYFRGYLGRALSHRFGARAGNMLQAGLFTLQPAHIGQGLPGLLGVFVFGLLAGWLVERRGSLWAAIGAHALANGLLIPLYSFA